MPTRHCLELRTPNKKTSRLPSKRGDQLCGKFGVEVPGRRRLKMDRAADAGCGIRSAAPLQWIFACRRKIEGVGPGIWQTRQQRLVAPCATYSLSSQGKKIGVTGAENFGYRSAASIRRTPISKSDSRTLCLLWCHHITVLRDPKSNKSLR